MKYIVDVSKDVVPCLLKQHKHLDTGAGRRTKMLESDSTISPILAMETSKNLRTIRNIYAFIFKRKNNVFVICCRNGRSRSPNILLVYLMIFHGYDRATASKWLKALFQSQRPYITSKSAEFPNFVKFYNVLDVIDKQLKNKSPDLLEEIKFVTMQYYYSCKGGIKVLKVENNYSMNM